MALQLACLVSQSEARSPPNIVVILGFCSATRTMGWAISDTFQSLILH